MSNALPVLDGDKVVRFTSAAAFAEGLGAIIAGQWLMVAPKTNIRLHQELTVSVRFDGADVQIAAVATPFYWRGPFLGMQVRAADPAAQAEAQALLRRHASGEFDEDQDISEKGAPVTTEEALVSALSEEPTVDSISEDQTEGELPEVEDDPSDRLGLEDPTRPGSELDGNLLEVPPEAAGPAVVQPEPPSVPAPPAPAETQVPAAEAAAAPAAAPASAMAGEVELIDLADELLTPYPVKGTGLPLPAQVSCYRMLAVLAANAASGLLEIENEVGKGTLFLRRGALLGADPPGSTFDDYFSAAIVQANLVDGELLQQCVDHCNENDKSLPLAMYEKRALSLDMLSQQLRETKTKLLGEIITSNLAATWSFTPMRKFSRRFDPIRLDLRAALIDVCRAHLNRQFARHLEPLLDDHRDHFPRVMADGEFPIDLLGLADKEEHAIEHVLNGANRLADAYGMCLLTRHGASRLFILLNHFGLLEWLMEATQTQSGESLEETLRRLAESMRSMHYFDRLDIHWASHPALFDVSLKKARKKYGPTSSLARRSEEAAEGCRLILEMKEDAVSFLQDTKNRRAHRVEHYGEDKMRYAADFLYKQSELNMFRGNQSNAVSLLETAIDLVKNPLYVATLRRFKGKG